MLWRDARRRCEFSMIGKILWFEEIDTSDQKGPKFPFFVIHLHTGTFCSTGRYVLIKTTCTRATVCTDVTGIHFFTVCSYVYCTLYWLYRVPKDPLQDQNSITKQPWRHNRTNGGFFFTIDVQIK
jgi:hypothetical protein